MKELRSRATQAPNGSARTRGAGLPPPLQQALERLCSLDLSAVQVHRDSSWPGELGAEAVTQGLDIHLAKGNDRHLFHEAWHAVQQREGRVRATGTLHGQPVNADPRLEREADRMGARARSLARAPAPPLQAQERNETAEPRVARQPRSLAACAPLQCFWGVGNLVTDALSGIGMTAVSNASWLVGRGAHVDYSPVLTGSGFATGMSARLPAMYPIPGGAAAAAAPANPAWTALNRKKTPGGGAFYVRAHLLRQTFGGHAQWDNLTPLTSAANNPSPLSHLNVVEANIQAALLAGRPVGYRVVPIYTSAPLGMPQTLVNTFIGLLPGGWCADLRNILYYESYVPSALWTSWWYADSWNPIPSVRLIRQWNRLDNSLRFRIKPGPGIPSAALTWPEFIVVAIAEIAKLIVSGLWPAGSAWSTAYRVAGSLGLSMVPGRASLEALAMFVDGVEARYPWWARLTANSLDGLDDRARAHVPLGLGGFVPSVATLGALGAAGLSAAVGGGAHEEL